MGIFSRSSNQQTSTTNNYNTDNRRVDTTTNEGDYAGNTGTLSINYDTPEAWQFGERAFETIRDITANNQDAFSQSLASINEANQSVLSQVVADKESGGASSMSKNIALTALAIGIGLALRA